MGLLTLGWRLVFSGELYRLPRRPVLALEQGDGSAQLYAPALAAHDAGGVKGSSLRRVVGEVTGGG